MTEIIGLNLDAKIDNELKKENITETVITELKNKYSGLELRDLDDKEMYLEIKDAIRVIVKVRTTATKICKKLREDAVRVQKLVIEKEKEVVGRIREIENPLLGQINAFEEEVSRKEKLEQERKEAILIQRQTELIKMGASFLNGSFSLDDVSFELSVIKDADEEIYTTTILPKYVMIYERKEAERIEAERIEAEKQKELKRQQEELEKQIEEFNNKKLEAERERIKSINELVKNRSGQLMEIGVMFSNISGYTYNGEILGINRDIENYNENDWNRLLIDVSAKVASIKISLDKKREEELKEEQDRIAKKAVDDAKLKEKQEQEKKDLEMLQSKDRVKWEDFISQLKNLVLYQMSTSRYQQKQIIAKEKIEEIIML